MVGHISIGMTNSSLALGQTLGITRWMLDVEL